jgi:hypothetical protein
MAQIGVAKPYVTVVRPVVPVTMPPLVALPAPVVARHIRLVRVTLATPRPLTQGKQRTFEPARTMPGIAMPASRPLAWGQMTADRAPGLGMMVGDMAVAIATVVPPAGSLCATRGTDQCRKSKNKRRDKPQTCNVH